MITRREGRVRPHARPLAALLSVLISSSPASAVSLYSGVKTRSTPAPLTGCCTRPVALPDVGANPIATAPTLGVPQLPQLPATNVPRAAEPIMPIADARNPASALDQIRGAAENVAKAEQPGDASTQAALLKAFDNASAPEAAPAEPFDPSLVEAAQRLYQTKAVAVGLPVRPEGSIPTDDELKARAALSPLTNPEREAAVVALIRKAVGKDLPVVDVPRGQAPRFDLYDAIQRQDAGRGRSNYIVMKQGRTDRVVVVGAHHDKVSEGRGVIDNWSGTTMDINLLQALHGEDTQATFAFALFAREEEGLIGSDAFVRSLPRAQRDKIDSMLNLDTLAVDGTFSWKNNSTRAMLDRVLQVAKAEKRDLVEARLDGGDADSSTFRRAGIPAMTLFGASQDVIFDIIHSSRDNIAAFSLDHYKNAYLLSLALLKAIDAAPIGRPGRV